MHRPYRDLQNLKFSCLYLFPFSHKVVPQKASGGGGSGVVGGGGGGGGRIPHFNWSIYRGGNFFLEPGVKLDEKSIENGLEGQKFLVVCLFWGGCHHPNLKRPSYRHSSERSDFVLQRLSIEDPVCQMKIVVFHDKIEIFAWLTFCQISVQYPMKNSFLLTKFVPNPCRNIAIIHQYRKA